MRFPDLLKSWGLRPVCFNLATNGLSPEKDKILMCGVYRPGQTEKPEIERVIRYVSQKDVNKGSAYHHISMEDILKCGLPDDEFKKRLADELLTDDVCPLTYNVDFQTGFLNALFSERKIKVWNLPLIFRRLNSGMAFIPDSFSSIEMFCHICQQESSEISMNQLFKYFRMPKDPAPGQLPLERFLDVLKRLYAEVSGLDIGRFQN